MKAAVESSSSTKKAELLKKFPFLTSLHLIKFNPVHKHSKFNMIVMETKFLSHGIQKKEKNILNSFQRASTTAMRTRTMMRYAQPMTKLTKELHAVLKK